MEGGGVQNVPVTIDKCGTAIAWEFNTEPKGIAFGIFYRSTAESSREDEVREWKEKGARGRRKEGGKERQEKEGRRGGRERQTDRHVNIEICFY